MKITGVFLLEGPISFKTVQSFTPDDAPLRVQALRSLLKSTASLPQLCILLAIDVHEDKPYVDEIERLQEAKVSVQKHQDANIYYVQVNVGFAEPLADLCLDN